MTKITQILNDGDVVNEGHFQQIKDVVNTNDDIATPLSVAYSTTVRADRSRVFDSVKQMAGNETLTWDSLNAVLGNFEVRRFMGDGNDIIFNDPAFSLASITTISGKETQITLFYDGLGVIVDQVGSSSTTPSYSYVNTHSMFVDALDEGVNITDDVFYFSDGAGADAPWTFLLWFKTPAVMVTNKRIISVQYDGFEVINVIINSAFRTQINIFTDASNSLRTEETDNIFSPSTWYYLAITYTGGKTNDSFKMYLNEVLMPNRTTNNPGIYTGLPAAPTNAIYQIPRTNASAGELATYNLSRVLNKALSLAEIEAHKTQPTSCPSSQLGNLLSELGFNQNASATYGPDGVEVGVVTYNTDLP